MELTPDVITTKVEKRMRDLSGWHDRMDKDFKLWNMEREKFDKHPMAINITSNDPRTLSDKLQARLVGAERSIIVKPPSRFAGPEISKVVAMMTSLFTYGLEQNDLRLRRILQPPLMDSLSWFVNNRGMAIVRVLTYEQKGKIVWNYTPFDPRFVAYAVGDEGLKWVAHTTYKTREALAEDYKFDVPEEGDAAKGLKVIEYIDETTDSMVCQGEWVKKPAKHGADYVPVVIVPVAIRPSICDDDGLMLVGYGESVYAPNRLEYEQCDKLASIEATHAHFLAKQPIIHEYNPANPSALDPKEVPYYPGAIIDIPKGERFYNLPTSDIPKSLELAIGRSRGRIQRAAAADIEYGQTDHAFSGTAISMLKEDIGKVLAPRKRTLDNVYTDICYMTKNQIVKQGLTVPIEIVGEHDVEAYEFRAEQLDNDFYIKVEHVSELAWEQLEKYQIYQMAVQNEAMSKSTARKNILKIADADKEDKLIGLEKTEVASPQLSMYKSIDTLIELGRIEEAMTLATEFRQALQAMQQPPGMGQEKPGGK